MAPSQESQALEKLFRTFSAHFPSDGNTYLQRAIYDQVHTAGAECPGVSYSESLIPTASGPRPALWAHPPNASSTHALLYMHGGGFSFGSTASHRKLFAHLANEMHVLGLSIDYRLTPEHPYPAPLDDCVDAFQHLVKEKGIPAENIAIAGDSAGGGLAVTLALALRRRGLAGPGASVSLSPLFDLTVSGESFDTNKDVDAINTKDFVKELGRRYTDGGKAVDYRDEIVSPLFAESLKGLNPVWVSVAGCDMLRDDGVKFADKAKGDGVDVVLEVHEGQQHVLEFMVGKAPEATDSVKRIGEWVRGKIGS